MATIVAMKNKIMPTAIPATLPVSVLHSQCVGTEAPSEYPNISMEPSAE
jgi:hypothetical protein|tara:strand:+ start:196 stop:342 length:147 start_codon:yes stop_codon:yes gene_type:complete